MAVRFLALYVGRSLPPRKIPGTHLCWRLSRLQGHSAAGKIRSIEKCNGLIGNATRDLPACSVVPQPTTLPGAPVLQSLPTKQIYTVAQLIRLNENEGVDIRRPRH
jgi:hypothetical protein